MNSRLSRFALASLIVAFAAGATSVRGQQSPAPSGSAAAQPAMGIMQTMSRMKANDEKLDALVQKMNAATGGAKADAMAELLTALVDDRRHGYEPMMANMMKMMEMMSRHAHHAEPADHGSDRK